MGHYILYLKKKFIFVYTPVRGDKGLSDRNKNASPLTLLVEIVYLDFTVNKTKTSE